MSMGAHSRVDAQGVSNPPVPPATGATPAVVQWFPGHMHSTRKAISALAAERLVMVIERRGSKFIN